VQKNACLAIVALFSGVISTSKLGNLRSSSSLEIVNIVFSITLNLTSRLDSEKVRLDGIKGGFHLPFAFSTSQYPSS